VRWLNETDHDSLSREEIRHYLKELKTGDNRSRAIAAYMLGTASKKDDQLKKNLKKALKDQNPEIRKWAALALGEMGERDSRLVPILIEVLKQEENKEFRSHAAIILGELEKRAAPAIPELHKALQEDDARLRKWASWALMKIAGEESRYRTSNQMERPKLSERLRFEPKDKEK
jgi:HEAT repeat protein